ncbi:MAG: carboxypeptidase-like regulatory domain-containing protein [Solirubrobacteraceae bacterium]
MGSVNTLRRFAGVALFAASCALFAPAGALGAFAPLTQIATTAATGGVLGAAFVRTSDGTLHLVYTTKSAWGGGFDGIGSFLIASTGSVSPTVQALSGWNIGTPGLFEPASGALEAVFGGSPDVNGGSYDGPWGVTSSDGGLTWSAPADIGSHASENFGGNMTAALTGGVPFLTSEQSGGLVIQQGLGVGSPTSVLNEPPSGLSGVTSAVDAASGEVVIGWFSNNDQDSLWMQGVAPTSEPALELVGNVTAWGDQQRQLTVVALDSGPGVYAAYSPSGRSVRLVRYGGGSVAVPVPKGFAPKGQSLKEVDVATGLDGRIWVMFGIGDLGDGKGVFAITRSNKARTRFEPVQVFDIHPGTLWRLYGDGRLGPLDLLANITPNGASQTGIYYARELPVLTVGVSAKHASKGHFDLTVTVTDAGDPVAGATVKVKGKVATTSSGGSAHVVVAGVSGGHVAVTVTAPSYHLATATGTL